VQKIVSALALLALPLAVNAMPCKFSAPRNADIDSAGLKALQLNLGSSDLDIQSVPGLTKVEVRATACASEASWLADMQVSTARSGEHASVDAKNNHNGMTFSLFGASSYAYLKLQVRVPAALAISIDSGSGDVHASSLASLDFKSGSGDLVVGDIAGPLALQLGSGDVQGHQVGSVELRRTGSGDVRVDGIQGNVSADHAGSGDLDFSHVSGSVKVGDTGSGDVTVSHVAQNVEVGSTGSGDVDAEDVGGNFTVHATGSGDVTHNGVKGKVDVPKSDDD
jgi:DUF4097 and DUF4098 domain-containing protein YvlB